MNKLFLLSEFIIYFTTLLTLNLKSPSFCYTFYN